MPSLLRRLTILVAVWLTAVAATAAEPEGGMGAVRPVLERHCLSCHNDRDRKGGLSLVSAETFRKGGESGAVVAPGDPSASYLLDMVTPQEGKAAMPKGSAPLSPEDLALLRDWIAAGAEWPETLKLEAETWWAFRPLIRPAVPDVRDAVDGDGRTFPIRTPIDAFISKTLQERKLFPVPEADRRTLIRRLYSDLLGLPPTPEQVRAFVQNDHPRAYEDLVEELLDSPHYGERWARHWLDVVKYADTCGYDKDKLRPNAWPYRDYVIRSFNEDKPYARFVQEQIAGDVLFPGTADGILGLGFIAAGPWDFIGHVEVPESKFDGKVARHLDRDEMVTNTLNTFCSVTIQCAQCHDHKFDPFTQAHYYGLQAVFAAVDRADRPYDLDPEVERRKHDLLEQSRQAREQLAALEAEIKAAGGDQLTALTAKVAELMAASQPREKDPRFGYHSAISPVRDDQKWVEVDLGSVLSIDRIVLRPCHDDFAGIGAGFGFPVRYLVQCRTQADGPWTTLSDRQSADVPNPGLLPVEITASGESARYVRVTATKLAERQHDFIFSLAELDVLDENGRSLSRNRPVSAKDSIEAPVRWGKANLTDGIFAAFSDEAKARELAAVTRDRDALLQRIETPERLARRQQLTTRIADADKALAALPAGRLVYAAATHFSPQGNFQPTTGIPRAVSVLPRGNLKTPGEPARPSVLPVIPGLDAVLELPEDHTEADRRRALALWLTHPENPLTWRSIVNRIWQHHFGSGLAATPNDFGRMGRPPSHPELLDWLAVEFRDGGQSLKSLHRLIVTSAVYRRSSQEDERNAAVDQSNQFLWRMNRRRLEAEEIRDATLTVAGRMNPQMGGPGYYLFRLEKPEHSPHYEYHKFDPADPTSHRRSIYRFIVRSQPDPYMTTLDCADSSQSTPKREETVTALQALSLLNNRFNLTMATAFAERLRKDAADIPSQVTRGFELVTGRAPDEAESAELRSYAVQYGLDNTCRILLNLNEFMYLD